MKRNILIISVSLFALSAVCISTVTHKTSCSLAESSVSCFLPDISNINIKNTEPETKLLEAISSVKTEESSEFMTATSKETTVIPKTVTEQETTTSLEPETTNTAYTYSDLEKTMYVTENLNVRTGPSTSFDIYTWLKRGTSVQITGQCMENDWYRILLNDKEFYVSNQYLSDDIVIVPVETKLIAAKETIEKEPVTEPITEPVTEPTTEPVTEVPTYEYQNDSTYYSYDDLCKQYPYVDTKIAGTLVIPSVGIRQSVVYGGSQDNIDNYDITVDTNDKPYGVSPYTMFAGHNTRSLGALHKTQVGDMIYFETNYGTFAYRIDVTGVGYVSEDKKKILSDTDNSVLMDFSVDQNHIKFYTCYTYENPTTSRPTNYRFIVIASLIDKPNLEDVSFSFMW